MREPEKVEGVNKNWLKQRKLLQEEEESRKMLNVAKLTLTQHLTIQW